MKRLLVILIMLGLILTGCAGIKETTKGEESPEEVITQQETKEPVESETTETEEPSKPEESTSPDGWDVSIGSKVWGDKTPLNEADVPEVCRGTIIDWMYTDFGLVIISSDKYVVFTAALRTPENKRL